MRPDAAISCATMTPTSQSKPALFKNFWSAINFKTKGALLCAMAATCASLALMRTGVGHEMIIKSYDWPFAFRLLLHSKVETPREAVIVYLDDASHQELHQPYTQPWNRAFHTRLLKRLTAEHAKAVVYDILFSDSLDPNVDRDFAQAIKENGKVILAVDSVVDSYNATGQEAAKRSVLPNPLFGDNAADLASDAFFPDDDLTVRKYLPVNPDEFIASEGWIAAKLIGAEASKDTARHSHPFWLNYYGPVMAIPSVSLYQALAENDPGAPPGFFKDKVVFVGARLKTGLQAQRKDEYGTAYSFVPENKFTPGVAIHATAFLNLARNDWLERFSIGTEQALIIGLGIFFGVVLGLCRPVPAVIIAVASIIPVVAANYFLFMHWHRWFPWLVVVGVQIPFATVVSVAYNSIQLYVQKRLVEQSLALYLSPKLVKKFAANPKLLQPGAEKQMLTVLFSDIAGFTTISEGMDSDALAKLMNNYFQSAVGNCIHSTEGTVVKYIGDAIFAFWNAPEPQSDHQFRAAEAALLFRDLPVQEINGTVLFTRIGLHTGVANVGNFGSTTRVDYTAIGENINLASRMEGLNKYLGTRVLLTAETQQGIGDRLVTRYLGQFRLKGFEKAVAVYELMGRPEEAAATQDWRQYFDLALQKFQAREFGEAEAGFNCVLEMKPDDPPTKFYLRQVEEFRFFPIPDGWKGEIELQEK